MKRLFTHFVRSLIDWVFRRRSPALAVARIGLCVLVLALAGWALRITIPTEQGPVSLSLDNSAALPVFLTWAIIGLGIALLVIGVFWEIVRDRAQHRRLARRKVIVIEGRGLRDTSGTPLAAAVPSDIEGQRDQLLVDIRQGVQDGTIIAPEAALQKIEALPGDLARREAGLDRQDLARVFGGLMPVPMTFLMGVLADDEGPMHLMDWDRYAGAWRPLDGDDDGARFEVTGLDGVPRNAADVVLAVSVSYRADQAALQAQFTGLPQVNLALPDGGPDCHWSEAKQAALGQQFLETAIAIGNRGVGRIHLVLAGQSTVAFRFGCLYDKRNLPPLTVHQYERGRSPPYPWGIAMPVAGTRRAAVVHATEPVHPNIVSAKANP